ncbi:hypothetical protein EKK58_01820 [Candidatus Dependentiae bacterium]|nr:MAG: hypothetical protein EKK58_01820 [Candidatus Dependentiae bacterium]
MSTRTWVTLLVTTAFFTEYLYGMHKRLPNKEFTFAANNDNRFISFLTKIYNLDHTSQNLLIKHNLTAFLGILLCQWFKTIDSNDKKATGTGLPFELLAVIFQDVLKYYGNDVLYSPKPIVTNLDSVTCCLHNLSNFNVIKNKYNLNDHHVQYLITSNFTILDIASFCQLWGAKKDVPFEIVYKIFEHACHGKKNNKTLYLDQESGHRLSEFSIYLPGVGTIKPRGLNWIIDLIDCKQEELTEHNLTLIDRYVIQKLQDYNIIKETTFRSSSLKKLSDKNSIYIKKFYFDSYIALEKDGSDLPVFPYLMLDRYYLDCARFFNDKNKKYSMVRSVFCREGGYQKIYEIIDYKENHYIIIYNGKEQYEYKLPTLSASEARYTMYDPFALTRYTLIYSSKKFIVLYDEKEGKYPVLPLPGGSLKCNSAKLPFQHENRIVNADTQDLRRHLFDQNREQYLKKVCIQEVPNNMQVFEEQPNHQEQIAQYGYIITKGGDRLNCLIQ